jgi:hypothetical protein
MAASDRALCASIEEAVECSDVGIAGKHAEVATQTGLGSSSRRGGEAQRLTGLRATHERELRLRVAEERDEAPATPTARRKQLPLLRE